MHAYVAYETGSLFSLSFFSGYGESAPQACLQIAIILIQGRCSLNQLFSVILSLISLSLCATQIYLTLPTKGKTFKDSSWKPKYLIVLPSMMLIVIPRIISISLMISYVKHGVLVIILLMLIVNLLTNIKFVMRDPAKTILGCLTNIFAPCIIVEEGSQFFKKSSLTSNLMHGISLVTMTTLVIFNLVQPVPCYRTQPPILHCFKGNNFGKENLSMMKCPITGKFFNLCI